MQIKQRFYWTNFESAAKVDKADVCIFETVILFLGEDAVIMDSSLGAQTILQYENQWGWILV